MDETNISNVQISSITPHPRFQNPRGRIVNTTDLQESVRADGVLQPILVEPNGDGYHLLGGERRLTAARLVGLEVIPAVIHEPKDDRERLRIIAASNMSEDVPTVIVSDGEIVGGKIYLIGEMFAVGMPRYSIAPLVGLTTDAVGACVALATDLPEVLQAVADDRLALTAYSLMKHKSKEFKLFVCSRRGQITASYVRDCIRDWGKIKAKLETAESEEEGQPENIVEEIVREKAQEKRPTAQLLQRALASLREVSEVEPQQFFILEEIQAEIERLT